jgi:hypothetical protein
MDTISFEKLVVDPPRYTKDAKFDLDRFSVGWIQLPGMKTRPVEIFPAGR